MIPISCCILFFKNMAIDSDGNKFMRVSNHMARDVKTDKIHAISSWPKDIEK